MIIKKIDGTTQEIPFTSDSMDVILRQFDDGLYNPYISKTDKVFLDIGSNVGLFALYVSPQASKIICLEPTPEHNEKAVQILKNNHPTFIVVIEEGALSDHNGEDLFYRNPRNSTNNSLDARDSTPFPVVCFTLAGIYNRFHDIDGIDHVDFCKIDIEGSEWKAITVETLKPVFNVIDKIFIELHPMTKQSQDAMAPIFEAVGYKVERVGNDTLFCHK